MLNPDQFGPPTNPEDRQAVVQIMRHVAQEHGAGPEGVRLHEWHRVEGKGPIEGATHWAAIGSGKHGVEQMSKASLNSEGAVQTFARWRP